MARALRALTAVDRALVQATQAGLPPVVEPFHVIAKQLGLEVEVVLERMRRMEREGIIRRVAAVPNHYRLGYTANGMSVWNIHDEKVDAAGRRLARLPFVTHCYRRPRRPPLWPYNLFAMVHATSREQVQNKVDEMRTLLDGQVIDADVLYSTEILKKSGLRLRKTG